MDEYAHLNKFFAALNDGNTWPQIFDDFRSIRRELEDGGWLDGQKFEDASYEQRIEYDLYRTFVFGDISHVFERRILDKFSIPPATAEDLMELAMQHLAGAIHDDEIKSSVVRFHAHLAYLTRYSCEDINIGHEAATLGDFRLSPISEAIRDCDPIWESEHGFSVAFNPEENRFTAPTLDVWGKFSDKAMATICESLKRVAPSACRSLYLLNCDPTIPDNVGWVPFEVNCENVRQDFAMREKGLFAGILGLYFSEPASKTSTLQQRLRNAVHLLVESDNQSSDAISLSLCFSAIEALMCEKTEGIVDELSRNVVSMLVPDALNRPDAIQSVKRLYNLRSKTLHGASVAGNQVAKWQARYLAAATLKAVFEWKEHVARMGAEVSRTDLLAELRVLSSTGKQMVGVSSDLFRFIPKGVE